MIISVNWLKKYTDITLPIDELATLIGARLVEIEKVIDLGAKYHDVVVAKVVECAKLENSDHLNVTKLDDGGATADIERDEHGYIQVVCGASNIRAGLTVAWLPPKATVPDTYSDAEPFVLTARKLRGVMSNGMIASAKELDLFDDHTGILELDDGVRAGESFAKAYELDDYLLDIENKSLTHRPDTFGVIGFAREVAAIQGRAFHTPEWLAQLEPDFGASTDAVQAPIITIENPELCGRYQAVVLSDADGNAVTPLQIQTYLARVGVRPISAVVDVTNYLMMLTGQPLHAFDYDKVVAVGGSADIRVRAGRDDEQLALLDDRTITLTPEDIVIAAGETAIGLAGAMGGANTEIDENTKNIIVESASFNLYNLRATQMRHGIFSEAITRFTKGQPAEQTAPVLAETVRLIGKYAGGRRASNVTEAYPGRHNPRTLTATTTQINRVLGTDLVAKTIETTLRNTEFEVETKSDKLRIRVPYWRGDIHITEDIVEEVGRLNGYDEIMPTLPTRSFVAIKPSSFDELRTRIRRTLVRAGVNEVLTYSFIHGDILKKVGQDPKSSYRITNSISPDLQYYRQSITPSLLGLVHPNLKAGYDDFALFELNKTHTKQGELIDGVPPELHRLAYVVAHKKEQGATPYYEAKHTLEYLAQTLGLQLIYKPFVGENTLIFTRPFEPKRSARVIDAASGQPLGVVGEYKAAVRRNFKLPKAVAGFELLPEAIALALAHVKPNYTPLSRYPSSERDICFKVDVSVAYGDIVAAVTDGLAQVELEAHVEPLDIYQAKGESTKNVTVRLILTSHAGTLAGEDIARVVTVVSERVAEATNAQVI